MPFSKQLGIVRYPPDTLFLLFLCVVSGITQLLNPGDALPTLPNWLSISWSVTLTFGSVTSLVGIFWKDRPVGFLIEESGRHMLWPACFAYALFLATFGKFGMSPVLVVAFGVTCLFRALYLKRVYNDWRELMKYDSDN